ncbi:MAG: endonuclease/exonuclease/phosphatase family protein [Planctomycetaceae bacterium]|jgi:endonuclease/exonuclease/phosphatase family metal-dependent hydrolase|nr:endonuclease/exonuclease/phosphatase family protein [Planctomycetaceae bacterium]
MIRFFCFLFVALFPFSTLLAEDSIRILSINVRLSTANDGEDNWVNRRDIMTEVITAGDYDFIGTQETVMHPNPEQNQVTFIASKLPEYGSFGRSRETDSEVGEAMMIFYKKNRWQMDEMDQTTFWLSDTPEIAGSKTDPAAGCTRSVTVALFHELKDGKPTGRKIYVYVTHYDHMSEEARQRGAKLLMERMAERKNKDVPVVVMGDMNCGEKSPAIRFMQGEPMKLDDKEWTASYKLTDTFRAANPDEAEVGTFHGFRTPGKDKIDYIFISPSLKTISSAIIRSQREGRYPTDHFPVEAVIAW